MSDLVTIEVKNHVADVRLNRPEKMNAINQGMWEAISNAGKELAEVLRCPPRKRWQRVSGIRRAADGIPICWSDIYVLPRFAGLAELIGTDRMPVYTLLEKHFDTRALRVAVELFADVIAPAHAGLLEVEPNSAALIIIRRYYDANETCFEVSVSRHPGDRFTYSMSMEREWGAGNFGA